MKQGLRKSEIVLSESVPVERGRRRFAKPKDVTADYGVPRYRLFEMLRDGLIRSALIKRTPKSHGMRLIDLDSLEEYLAQFITGGKSK